MKKPKRIQKECKKHGITEHGIYFNKKLKIIFFKCLTCAREKRKERYKDPIKRAHDIAYANNWSKENRDNILKLKRKKNKQIKLSRDKEVREFLKNENNRIINLLLKTDSNISKRDLNKHCLHYHITSFEQVKNFILSNKKRELSNLENWKQSSLVKYHYGVIKKYNELSENEKANIRFEYHNKTKKIVNKKIEEICKTI